MNKVKQGQNQYCVPAVISILTGKDTDECARAISRVTGSSRVEGVAYTDTLEVLKRLGMQVTSEPQASDQSLFSSMHYLSRIDGMYIVGVPGHVVAIEVKEHKVYLCDNHTKEPISGAASARLGQRVDKVYKVSVPPPPTVKEIRCIARPLYREYSIETHWSDSSVTVDRLIVECIE